MSELSQTVTSQINMIQEDCAKIEPLVCIRCITFNHEPYIRDALEGFVMQKTNFPFVAIVHDDASTDKTADIIREYADKYPEIIKPIFEDENQYSKKDGSLSKIIRDAIANSGAKYIAMCEGDDYWTDPLKLQKQVDFLELHPDYSMCFHGANVKNELVNPTNISCDKIQSREFFPKEILETWIVPTCSVLMRRECVLNFKDNKKYIVGDIVMLARCASFGRIWGEEKHMATYRRNATSWTVRNISSENVYKNEFKWIDHYEAMKLDFPKIDNNIFDGLIVRKMAGITIHDIKKRKNFYKNFVRFFKRYKFRYIYSIFSNVFDKYMR